MTAKRQQLAQAIGRLKTAEAERERVEEALGRLTDQFFEDLQPQLRLTMDWLAEARRGRPGALVAMALGDAAPPGLAIADAEAKVAAAEKTVAENREARKLLEAEAERRRVALALAQADLDDAITAVVAASPEVEALRTEFEATRQHLSHIIGALKAAGQRSQWPIALDAEAFAPNSEWAMALAALRTDAGAQLPGLPPVVAKDAAPTLLGKQNGQARARALADL
jgi:hypothetical protein